MMPTLRRRLLLLPLLTLFAPTACGTSAGSGAGNVGQDNPSGSSSTSGSGTSSPGGTTTGSTTSNGASTGGTTDTGTGTGTGSTDTNGTTTTDTSGSTSTDTSTDTSGSSTSGGGSDKADAGTGGSDGSGVITVTEPPPSDGGIPAGYPMPTAATYQKCQTVPISATACAGQPTGNICIECLFGGTDYNNSDTPPPAADATAEAGEYLVTVQLGGAAASNTYVSAESERGLLAPVALGAGQSATYSFVVDVRGMEGQPNHAGGPGGYPGLDLFFSGPAATPPAVSAIGYELFTAATKPIMIYMASDSTECDQTGGAFGGWGQMLPEFFAPPIGIANYGNSGASSSSFYGAYWPDIKARWKAGDYAMIQFGHNDKTVTDAVVQANLEKYVEDAKAAGVTAILVSPPARVQFGTGTTDGPQTSLHAASALGASMAEGVAYIDLTSLSTAWYNTLGSQAAALKFHANDSDATHTNLVGAQMLASLVAGNIKTQNLPLAQYLR
jgi:lysophospholipase L1-like esterase